MDNSENETFLFNIESSDELISKALNTLNISEISNYSNINLKNILDKLPGGVAILEISDEIKALYVNDILCNIYGYVKDKNNNYINIRDIILTQEELNRIRKDIDDAIKKETTIESKYFLRNSDGSLSHMMFKGTKIGYNNGFPIIVAIMVDVTKEVKSENDLKYQLEYDNVTGIFNKDEFYKRTYELLMLIDSN